MDEGIKILHRTIAERFIKISWTHKIQEKQADIYAFQSRRQKTLIAILTAFTSGLSLNSLIGLFADCEIANTINGVITAVSAIVATILTLRYKDGVLDEKANACRRAAEKCHDLRNYYESLLTDIVAGYLSPSEIISKRDALADKEHLILPKLPHTTNRAVKKAIKALKENKESIVEDIEIQSMLPKHLQMK